MARLDRAVIAQTERLRDLVHKLTHDYEADFTVREGDTPAMKAMLGDLSLLKGQLDERTHLWKSEAQAVMDQISRQQEILSRFGEELVAVRQEQSSALDLVRSIQGGEEHFHEEVCVMERDLERWTTGRRRLLRDLENQAATLDRARRFEEQLRRATDEMTTQLGLFETEINMLRSFSETAKVHSVNISLSRDTAEWEFASKARAFAESLSQFVAKAESIASSVRAFMKAHPGGAFAAHLNGAGLDEELLSGLSEEQESLSATLKRWRQSGEQLLSGGEKALLLLQDAEKKGAVLSQLGETSLLINQQAKGNLERWH
jgi:hypothetical protein